VQEGGKSVSDGKKKKDLGEKSKEITKTNGATPT